jgi:ERCC4-type nuclease
LIFVDDRIGSDHLAPILISLGHPVTTTRLEYGDVVFAGLGPNGTTVQVAIELKRLPDLLGSFASGRFTNHQLPGLTAGFDQCWLLVEGRYRAGESGILEWANERPWKPGTTICNWSDAGYGFRRWMYRELEGRLTTLQVKAGIKVARTSSPDDTARFIGSLYDWWTGSEYAEHRSHEAAFFKAQMPMLRPPTLRERIACQLPGIGEKKAMTVAATFDSVRAMINADRDAWTSIDRIGKKMADTIIAAVESK